MRQHGSQQEVGSFVHVAALQTVMDPRDDLHVAADMEWLRTDFSVCTEHLFTKIWGWMECDNAVSEVVGALDHDGDDGVGASIIVGRRERRPVSSEPHFQSAL